jgi:hypothetical protein
MRDEKPGTMSWQWLRFIPLQLHLALPYLGFLVGRSVCDPEGGYIGLAVGFGIGLPLHFKKRRFTGPDVDTKSVVTQWLIREWDLDRRRNNQQLMTGCVVAVCGAAFGFQMGAPEHLQGAILGTILGFVAGVFATGIVFMIIGWLGEIRSVARWVFSGRTPPDTD